MFQAFSIVFRTIRIVKKVRKIHGQFFKITGSRRSSLVLSGNPPSRKTSEKKKEEKKEPDLFSGTYEFQRYDDHLEEYLDSLGLMGRDLGRIIRQTRVKIELKKPRKKDEKWTLTTYEYSKN